MKTNLHIRLEQDIEGSLAYHIATPHSHCCEHGDEADLHQPPAIAMHEQHGARRERARSDRADDRPGARIDEVVGMLRAGMRLAVAVSVNVGVGHLSPPRSLNLRQISGVDWPPHSASPPGSPTAARGTSCRTA